MFDPQTSILIREAPELAELDRQRLPENLTKAFAEIVAFRLRLANAETQLPSELQGRLDEFRRMAATYETMVALLPERSDRRSAAFVAAQAHHLLHLARSISEPNRPTIALSAEAIAPEVSALLLFLIANQLPDATEMAREVEKLRQNDSGPTARLADAICALAKGRLQDIPPLVETTELWPDDSCDAAVIALYRRILHGLSLFARFVLDAQASPDAAAHALEEFREVQKLSLEQEEWPLDFAGKPNFLPVSAFAGPHHLASLLIGATDFLSGAALSVVPPPDGVSPATWRNLVRPIAAERPFLWPNHIEALEKGFLQPGTSSVVSFPTGAGKTTLSVLKAASALGLGGAVIYLAPTHALVAQMKADLAKAFPSIPVRDSILVEDFYAEIGESFADETSQIVVMTPERCLALLSLEEATFGLVRLVIFDECHLIHPRTGGQNRRSIDAMFALLQLHKAAPNCDWLLLSAMMANAAEIAGWIGELTNRKCLTLTLNWKPTRQARGCLVYDNAELDRMKQFLRTQAAAAPRRNGKLGTPSTETLSNLHARPYGFIGLQQTWQNRELRNYTLLQLLEHSVPLSATRSTGSYATWYPTPNKNTVASYIAAQCVRLGLKVLLFSQSPRDTKSIARTIDELLTDECPAVQYDTAESALLRIAVEEAGRDDVVARPSECAGSHNANLLPAERELAESLFRRSKGIHALAATATLAQGMNLPADVVLIVGDERFDAEAEGFEPLDPHELLNAAGRAGRAGLVAQGLVIVIPHTFVSFDPKKKEIGKKWTELQEKVFSQSDQCLSIQDPIQHLLDKVQDAAAASDPEVLYFLRRLPRGAANTPSDPRQFLRTTLAGWHAKKKHEEARFNAIIERTLLRRVELEPQVRAETWRDEMAYRTGVPIEFIEALHSALLLESHNLPETTEAWVRWFFTWLRSDARWLEAVFGHRLTKKLREDIAQSDLFGGTLADAVWGWMSGETLLVLDRRLGGKPDKPGKCDQARKFVLKMIPDLAFAAGLLTRIHRGQIDEYDGAMPLSLATLALCIREGLSQPELAALKLHLGAQPMSRASIRAIWARIENFAPRRDPDEKFGVTRRRISTACTHANARGVNLSLL